MNGTKEYLGDSVYADFDGFGIVLTTENGLGPSNRIVLEPEVMAELDRYVERLKTRLAASNPVEEKSEETSSREWPAWDDEKGYPHVK